MNVYFQQLHLAFPSYNETVLKGQAYRSYPGLTYYHIADPVVYNELQKLCPIQTEFISYMEITDNQSPHIDYKGTVNLNYYIQSGPAKTNFYTNDNNVHTIVNESPVYQAADCDWQCSFIAKNNSAYLLNTNLIHSVTMLGQLKRTAISFLFPEHSYNEVVLELKHLWC